MQSNGQYLEVLSQNDLKMIHESSLEILEKTGVRIPNKTCLEFLKESGACVDFVDQRVRFSPELVNSSIALAPSTFTLFGRAPGRNVLLGNGVTHFMNATTGMQILLPNGHHRMATFADMIQCIRLVDALENLSISHYFVHPSNLPEKVARASNVWGLLHYSTKPFIANGYGCLEATTSLRFAEVVGDGNGQFQSKPLMFHVLSPLSPLGYDSQLLEGTVEFAKKGIPVVISPAIMAGASGPATLAGTLTLQNAEILSGIVLLQIIKPHLPVIYGTASSILDMRKGQMPYASIEASLINVATAQMARFYGIPSRGTAGTSDAHSLDMQAGFEAGIGLLIASLAGLDYIHSVGLLSSTLVVSLEKLVIDEEIIGMISRFRRGVIVNESTLAIDIINKVGPGGNYLKEKHTVDHYMSETFFPLLTCRDALQSWIDKGSKDISKTASQRVHHILDSTEIPSLPGDQEKELDSIMKGIAAKEGVSWPIK